MKKHDIRIFIVYLMTSAVLGILMSFAGATFVQNEIACVAYICSFLLGRWYENE